MKQNIQKISINIGTNVLDKIDSYANEMGVNRSAAITFLCNQYFNGIEAMSTLKDTTKVLGENKKQ